MSGCSSRISLRSESSMVLPSESLAPNKKKLNEDRPPGEMTPFSRSDDEEAYNLCQAARHLLNIVNSEENPYEMSYADPPECPSWDAIPWPPLERICHYLFNPYDGTDLANLAKVSAHYNNGVMKFMNGRNIRPGIRSVTFVYDPDSEMDVVRVSIVLVHAYLPFYDLNELNKRRCKAIMRNWCCVDLRTLSSKRFSVCCLLASRKSNCGISPRRVSRCVRSCCVRRPSTNSRSRI
ncbi:hypothetical protein PMAYCL1PPCAC_03477 [Pristionchus mayeri]|uniref:Uncharacterized protein n=1 Tax=Pristionchus mayeri TaxID=1317129 RepID=A0AAN4Z8K2_9BILA|nr:hypothetical protein PMAYCL1PPCAC_03477 [Pristionchus mayeri]